MSALNDIIIIRAKRNSQSPYKAIKVNSVTKYKSEEFWEVSLRVQSTRAHSNPDSLVK